LKSALALARSRPAFYALLAGLFLTCAFFVWRSSMRSANALSETTAADLILLVSAYFCVLAAVLAGGLIWSQLLTALDGGKSSWAKLLRSFLLVWPARYIPGTMPYHAARVLMAEQMGTTRLAVGASIAYETLLAVGAAGLIALIVLLPHGLGDASAVTLMMLASPLLILPVALQPGVILLVTRRLAFVPGLAAISREHLLPTRKSFLVVMAYGGMHCLNGLGFYIVLEALGGGVSPVLALGVYSAAAAAGVLVFFVPSGIGVREGMAVALLAGTAGAEVALVAASLTRLVTIVADLTPFVLLNLVAIRRRLRGVEPPSMPGRPTAA